VDAVTLDKLFVRAGILHSRLLKIDCEGAEWGVVRGAVRVLNQHLIDYVAMAYHPTICGVSKCDEIHRTLTDAGYSLLKVAGTCIYHLPSLPELLALPETRVCSDWRD
jgi:hypothetical protein